MKTREGKKPAPWWQRCRYLCRNAPYFFPDSPSESIPRSPSGLPCRYYPKAPAPQSHSAQRDWERWDWSDSGAIDAGHRKMDMLTTEQHKNQQPVISVRHPCSLLPPYYCITMVKRTNIVQTQHISSNSLLRKYNRLPDKDAKMITNIFNTFSKNTLIF